MDHKLEYRLCRRSVLGHAWEFGEMPYDRPVDRTGIWVTKRCGRCGTFVHIGMDAYGQIHSRQYHYPEGYKYDVDEVPTSEELRLMMADKYRNEMKRRRKQRFRAV